MQIRKIISNGKLTTNQNEIEKAISKFYKELYKKEDDLKDIKQQPNSMFENLPKLNQQEVNTLKSPLTIEEMHQSLLSCNESAPGPDGITYNTYKKLWPVFGTLIHEAWEHSNKTGKLADSQKDSIITLLEKKRKRPNNYRKSETYITL